MLKTRRRLPPHDISIREYISAIVKADAKQFTSASEFFKRIKGFFELTGGRRVGHVPVPGEDILSSITQELSQIKFHDWGETSIKKVLDDFVSKILRHEEAMETLQEGTEKGVRAKLNVYLRWAVMGSRPGPPMVQTMAILGQFTTIFRLQEVVKPDV